MKSFFIDSTEKLNGVLNKGLKFANKECFKVDFLREAHGNKTLVLLQGARRQVLRARRARNTSPLGRVVEL